jgi:hypothetical protein
MPLGRRRWPGRDVFPPHLGLSRVCLTVRGFAVVVASVVVVVVVVIVVAATAAFVSQRPPLLAISTLVPALLALQVPPRRVSLADQGRVLACKACWLLAAASGLAAAAGSAAVGVKKNHISLKDRRTRIMGIGKWMPTHAARIRRRFSGIVVFTNRSTRGTGSWVNSLFVSIVAGQPYLWQNLGGV